MAAAEGEAALRNLSCPLQLQDKVAYYRSYSPWPHGYAPWLCGCSGEPERPRGEEWVFGAVEAQGTW